MTVTGADVEVIGWSDADHHHPDMVVIPRALRINGEEILVPNDATIEISPMSNKNFVQVTLTICVRSLTVCNEPPK